MIWAEVIGDPIAHSKSPAIHRFWLDSLGLEGDYRATRVQAGDLEAYFAERLADPEWRGCNVTIPHKKAVLPFLAEADAIGAVNCIVPESGRLIGRNTDVDGLAEALAGADLSRVAMIGAGGAAKAALAWLQGQGAGDIRILAREPRKASENLDFAVHSMDSAQFRGATLVINASPLGMTHAGPMLEELLAALPSGATALDMVYQPLDTPFLQAARAKGLRTVDGLTMLIGQARRAFALFFGAAPPAGHDSALRDRLIAGTSSV